MQNSKTVKQRNKTLVLAICALMAYALIFCPSSARANTQYSENGNRKLFSLSASQTFYEIAYELVNAEDISTRHAEEAIVLLNAATALDGKAKHILSVLIKAHLLQDAGYQIRDTLDGLLADYVDESADLEVVRQALWYLLEQLDSREQREKLLEEMLKNLGGKNAALDSELATLFGLLKAEASDPNAVNYLWGAYTRNKYNNLAFEKLVELTGGQIEPLVHLEHLRLALGKNPLDIEAVLAFAQYAEHLQLYDIAADTYKYCADLFRSLYPSEALPASLYLPWAISSYNTQQNQHRCLQIVDELRQSDRFDFLAEAVAGKAAAKIGKAELAKHIFQAAEDKAQARWKSETGNRKSEIASQLAWFYCFALPHADKAIYWASTAYSTGPDSTTAAILAYSLVMNEQTKWTRPFIENYERNQIADLVMAHIQLSQGQQDSAIETLKSTIAADPGSLVAEKAKELLLQQGQGYVPLVDPNVILTMLENSFRQRVVPEFVSPEKIISFQLNIRGRTFSYGSDFGATVIIRNNSSEPLVISDDGLIKGGIRVDARISGDIDKNIPNLVFTRIQPALPVESGNSFIIPVHLLTGELGRTLLTHPQASLNIEFTVYLDPVITAEGVTCRLVDVKPAKVLIKRPGIKLTAKYLQNRLNSLSRGRQGQKIKIAQLFAGLLAEQHAAANTEPLYKFRYDNRTHALLKSALQRSITDNDWVVRTHTMAAMLSLPLDYELTNAIAQNLSDTRWPVRLMAVSLLARSQGRNFDEVLDWTAKYDSSKLVQDMAIALGAAVPQIREPANQLTQDNSKQ